MAKYDVLVFSEEQQATILTLIMEMSLLKQQVAQLQNDMAAVNLVVMDQTTLAYLQEQQLIMEIEGGVDEF